MSFSSSGDRILSAGDDGSLHGLMSGLGLGHFADYVRGDASLSYKDRSVRSSTPALRADRSVLFVKQGPNPYIVVADDIQKDSAQHDYHWQWFTPARSISGAGTLAEPFLIEGKNARCKIAFLAPEKPSHDFQVVKGGYKRRPIELGLLRVNRKAVRAEVYKWTGDPRSSAQGTLNAAPWGVPVGAP